MSAEEAPQGGIYQHYKGPLYLVLGLAHDANADTLFDAQEELQFPEGREVVVYVGLQLDEAHPGARLAVRTLEDFNAWLHEDGSLCEHACPGVWCNTAQSLTRPRFRYVGARYGKDMLA